MTHIVERWWADLLGIRWLEGGRCATEGLDCYGLVRVAAARLGHDLPDWPTLVARQALQRLSGAALELGWTEVRPTQARRGDLVVFRHGAAWNHVGLVVERDLVLHAPEGHRSQTLRLSRWRGQVLVFRAAAGAGEDPCA